LADVPVKASALLASAHVGSGALKASALANVFTAQWEFNTYALAVELALFGVLYRCIVRSDDNDMLRQGAVAACALCHALSSTQVYKMWSASMWVQLGTYFSESAIAFLVAAATLEFAWSKGYAHRLPGRGLPQSYRYGWGRFGADEPPGYLDEPPVDFVDEPPPYGDDAPMFYRDDGSRYY